MSAIILNGFIVVIAFAAMEGVAWLAHKYVMHGFLWSIHRDHHKKEHGGFFEFNDLFFLLFATPGVLLIHFGAQASLSDPRLWAGVGIALYGFAYMFVHDIFIHQRFRILSRTETPYLKALRRAHKIHHKHLGKEDGECFGMLWVPARYRRQFKQAESKL